VLIDKLPPHDIVAEESVIGSLLIDREGDAIYQINQFLKPDDFFSTVNQWCYQSCLDIMNRGEVIDQITLAQELSSKGKLDEIGGVAYLSQVISEVPTHLHIEHYARIVKKLSIARRTISTGQKIMAQGYEETDPNKMVSESEKLLLNLQKEVAMPKLLSPKDIAEKAIDRYTALRDGKRKGIYTGFADLDEALGGLFGGELCYLAARPKSGKSEILVKIAVTPAKHFGNVLLASLEQPWGEVLDRWISGNLNISPRLLRLGKYSDERFDNIINQLSDISESNLWFYDSGGDITGSTSKSIYSVATHMKTAYGLSSIFVDQLSNLRIDSRQSLYEKTTEVSHQLKALAMDLDVPVMCAAQINRETERTGEHKPQISQLRDCITGDTEILDWHGLPQKVSDYHYKKVMSINEMVI